MELPVAPPVAPMLARLTRSLPSDGYVYEPKWDGFRCLVFRQGAALDMRSRNDRPLARYFPELAEGFARLREQCFTLDGEIVIVNETGADFAALLSRLHPSASRVERLRHQTPASFVAFDLLSLGDRDLRNEPFSERRRLLEGLMAAAQQPLHHTPVTEVREEAEEWLKRFRGAGIDGIVAKHRDLKYQPGKRAMVKVKLERTVDCVVAGYRLLDQRPAMLSSLLLGLYDDAGDLHHVGVASAFSDRERRELISMLRPYFTTLVDHPWEHGYLLGRSPVGRLQGAAGRWTPDLEHDWVPLRPELVCEVAYDQFEVDRFRHAARFRRWRPDREPRSCTLDQLETSDAGATLALLRGSP